MEYQSMFPFKHVLIVGNLLTVMYRNGFCMESDAKALIQVPCMSPQLVIEENSQAQVCSFYCLVCDRWNGTGRFHPSTTHITPIILHG